VRAAWVRPARLVVFQLCGEPLATTSWPLTGGVRRTAQARWRCVYSPMSYARSARTPKRCSVDRCSTAMPQRRLYGQRLQQLAACRLPGSALVVATAAWRSRSRPRAAHGPCAFFLPTHRHCFRHRRARRSLRDHGSRDLPGGSPPPSVFPFDKPPIGGGGVVPRLRQPLRDGWRKHDTRHFRFSSAVRRPYAFTAAGGGPSFFRPCRCSSVASHAAALIQNCQVLMQITHSAFSGCLGASRIE